MFVLCMCGRCTLVATALLVFIVLDLNDTLCKHKVLTQSFRSSDTATVFLSVGAAGYFPAHRGAESDE
jgi:hypothetical protein